MKYDILSLITSLNLNQGSPAVRNREPLPTAEEPALPEIDYALIAAIVQPKNETRQSLNARFSTAASANA